MQQASSQPDGLNPSQATTNHISSPMTFGRWLRSNSILLILIVAGIIAFAYYVQDPLDQAWSWTKALIGLGFIIFIHELGHFAVAKWCDVHVETFSIGFGPAIPGCSFHKGETLYKIALIPLGGYVKMVGEGTEEEGDENNPRSFKNKPVGQRMAIISAGVIMNILFGFGCFAWAYGAGAERHAAVIGTVETNSPAWKKGLTSGSVIDKIGRVSHPYFEDLQFEVMLSDKGEQLDIITSQPGEKQRETSILPRRDSNDSRPVIGISPVSQLRLVPREFKRVRPNPVRIVSAANLARQLDIRTGDQILETTDPSDNSKMLLLPKGKNGTSTDFMELSERFEKFAGRPIDVLINRLDGKKERHTLEPGPFQFGDEFIATTDDESNNPYDPYRIKDLPVDKRDPDGKNLDYFEFSRRMKRLAGKPLVVRVRHNPEKGPETIADIFVPPAYHYTIPGVIMEIGSVAGIRENSPADQAGVKVNDKINQIELHGLLDGNQESKVFSTSASKDNEVPDPMRLPFELRQWAAGHEQVNALITVYRLNPENHKDELQTLKSVPWESPWQFDDELSLGLASPLPIPELGLAYQVKTTIAQVGSSAEKTGLRRDDVIWEITTQRFKSPAGFLQRVLAPLFNTDNNENVIWIKDFSELWTDQDAAKDEDKKKAEPCWVSVFQALQRDDFKMVKLAIKRPGEKETIKSEPIELVPDRSWPIEDRGFDLHETQTRIQKASNFAEACSMGLTYTIQMVQKTYMGLKSMITNRISFSKSVSGPITIAAAAQHFAGKDMVSFLLFLGLISVNLAVVNFLPIPVLDGGHMVFLIYEKVRGKPASERVREVLTYAGVAMIISLMLVVCFLDVKRLWQAW
ncbi:MAG TPA: site-2 protease family protein [Gemmataceae bacterium]|nr:site-2 protease family protein [Gemmataceae bacterium]